MTTTKETPEQRDKRLALERKSRELGLLIEHAVGGREKCGFLLMLFGWGDGGHLAYFSNAQRADVVRVLQEFIDREMNKS